MATKRKAKEPKTPSVFDVWKEYEKIAMHFNELLIQLRTRALGGIAVITALVSVLSKGETASDFRWSVLSAVLFILTLVWIAIWIIDVKYYRRLLYGSVRAVLEIEAISNSHKVVNSLRMSHRIKEAIESGRQEPAAKHLWSDAIAWFYTVILVSLIAGMYISLDQHCTQLAKASSAQGHAICRVLPNWNKVASDRETR